jgi:competence protein ComEC
MGLVVAGAILLDRRWHSLNSLAFAGLIILLVFPLSLFTLGFQLSFVAVLGILLVVPDLMNRLRRLPPSDRQDGRSKDPEVRMPGIRGKLLWLERPVVGLLLTTVAATLAVSPILVLTFHFLPTYSLLSNLLVVPLLTAALLTGIVASVVGLVSSAVGAWILAPAAFLVQIIVDLALFFSRLPGSLFHLPQVGTLACGLMIALAGSAIWFIRKPCLNRSVVLTVSAVGLAGYLMISAWGWPQSRELRVVFFNVGKADAEFVKPPGSRGLLIDAGIRTPYFDAGSSILIPYFERLGIYALDGILISHPQTDHMGGVLSLIQRAPPRCLWWNPVAARSSLLEEILIESYSSAVQILPADRTRPPVRIGKAILRFLNPPGGEIRNGQFFGNLNNASVICRLEYGSISFLFTGDIEHEAEEELLASGMPLRASVLKVAHHGCKSSTSDSFLEAVRPRIAVISCDDYPGRPCPDAEVRRRLRAVGADILWTGRDGAVTMQTDGERLTARIGGGKRHILVEGTGHRSDRLTR